MTGARDHRVLRVVVCIDVEPDARTFALGEPPPWLGFELLVERIEPIRERLAELTGAPPAFNWLLRMDPQIEAATGSAGWVAERYAPEIERLGRAGDTFGIHVHPWRWRRDERDWVVDLGDPEWAIRCLDVSVAAFRDFFGRRVEVHRGGDGFLSGQVLARLAEHEIRVDTTIEPGRPPGGAPGGERTIGSLPDLRRAPAHPYRSSPKAFPAPDPSAGSGPVLLPLFSTAPSVRPLARRWVLTLESRPRVFAARLAAERALRSPEVLVFAVRSDAPLRPRWEALTENLDHLCRHHAMFVPAVEAAENAIG